ncbi:unnamed protein product [Closterium sp. Yama58-4]|nr:unnamed protein product [Closterium sp. Yama58-4]
MCSIHHCIGDGVSLMSLLLACTRRTDNPALLPTLPTVKCQTRPQPTSAGSPLSSAGSPPSSAGSPLSSAGSPPSSGGSPPSSAGSPPSSAGSPPSSAGSPPSSAGSPPSSAGSPPSSAGSPPSSAGSPPSSGITAAVVEESEELRKQLGDAGVVVVLLNTLWHVSTFMAVLLWRADTATCIKMKPGSVGMRLKAVKGGTGSGAVRQQPDEGRGEVQTGGGGTGGGDAGGGDGSGEGGDGGGGRFVFGVSGPMSLTDISRVRRAFGATINDVMVTVVSGGLDRYLRHHHEQQAQRAGERELSMPPPASPNLPFLTSPSSPNLPFLTSPSSPNLPFLTSPSSPNLPFLTSPSSPNLPFLTSPSSPNLPFLTSPSSPNLPFLTSPSSPNLPFLTSPSSPNLPFLTSPSSPNLPFLTSPSSPNLPFLTSPSSPNLPFLTSPSSPNLPFLTSPSSPNLPFLTSPSSPNLPFLTSPSSPNLPFLTSPSSPNLPFLTSPSSPNLPFLTSPSSPNLPFLTSPSSPNLPFLTSPSSPNLPFLTSPSSPNLPFLTSPSSPNLPFLTSPSSPNLPFLTSPSSPNLPFLTSPSSPNLPFLTSPSSPNLPFLTSPSSPNLPFLTSPSSPNLPFLTSPSSPNLPFLTSPSSPNLPFLTSPSSPNLPFLTSPSSPSFQTPSLHYLLPLPSLSPPYHLPLPTPSAPYPPAPVATSPLPATVRLNAVCVVNIRPAPGLQEMSFMLAGRSKARWGNCIGTLLLPLPVHSPALTKGLQADSSDSKGSEEGDAAGEVEQRRLRMVASMCASKRQSLEAHCNYANGRLVLAAAGMKAACTLMDRMCSPTTLTLSNMMGPVEEVSLGGHAIERISPTVLGQPHALTMHFQTYNGAAHIVLTALRENVPDPALLMRCCEDAFAALQASLPPVKVKFKGDDLDASLQLKEPSRDAEPLSPTARFFLSDEFYTTVLCALEFKDRMEIGELRTILSDTLLKHPRFHSRMEHRGRCKGGDQVWVRTTVDMAYHVVEGTQPDGCDNNEVGAKPSIAKTDECDSSAEKAHEEGAASRLTESEGGARPAAGATSSSGNSACYEAGSMEWHMRRLQHHPPFDASRPLWRVHLVPLPHGRSAALFRIHHSMGDGVSLMSLLLACTRRTDNPALLPTLPTAKRQTHPRPSGGAAAAVVEESEELRKQLGDSGGPEEEEQLKQLKPGQAHMPSAASAFTLDSMTASPFNPDPVGQAGTEAAVPAEGVTADAGRNGSADAGGGVALEKGAGALIAVLGNTLWHVSTFMAVLLWRADTATCIKMKPQNSGAQKKAGKGGMGSSAVLQQPNEGRGEVQTGAGDAAGGGDAVMGDGSGDGGGGRFVFGVSGPMSLTDISRVRRAFGATINDVMVTVISGGLDRYLRHHHGKAERAAEKPAPVATSPLPATVRLNAVCVVNIRPAPGLQEISSMLAGRSKARWGNCLGTFLLPLPVHSPALTKGLQTKNGTGDGQLVKSKDGDAAGEVEQRRMRLVASMCASKRQSLEAHYNYVNARLVLATAGMKAACTLMGRMCSQTTIAFSNMMGPVEEVSLGGHVIERISPTVLGQPQALTLHFQTYNGAAHIVLSGLRENVPDPAFLMRCCEDAFAALQASVH